MKKQKMNKKISLNKETIAKLGNDEMGKLIGGGTTDMVMHSIGAGCPIVPITDKIGDFPPIDWNKIINLFG